MTIFAFSDAARDQMVPWSSTRATAVEYRWYAVSRSKDSIVRIYMTCGEQQSANKIKSKEKSKRKQNTYRSKSSNIKLKSFKRFLPNTEMNWNGTKYQEREKERKKHTLVMVWIWKECIWCGCAFVACALFATNTTPVSARTIWNEAASKPNRPHQVSHVVPEHEAHRASGREKRAIQKEKKLTPINYYWSYNQ